MPSTGRLHVSIDYRDAETIADELQAWAMVLMDMAANTRLAQQDRQAAVKSACKVNVLADRLYGKLPADLGY